MLSLSLHMLAVTSLPAVKQERTQESETSATWAPIIPAPPVFQILDLVHLKIVKTPQLDPLQLTSYANSQQMMHPAEDCASAACEDSVWELSQLIVPVSLSLDLRFLTDRKHHAVPEENFSDSPTLSADVTGAHLKITGEMFEWSDAVCQRCLKQRERERGAEGLEWWCTVPGVFLSEAKTVNVHPVATLLGAPVQSNAIWFSSSAMNCSFLKLMRFSFCWNCQLNIFLS